MKHATVAIEPAEIDVVADAMAADHLARVVARYFETRYPGITLIKLYGKTLGDESALARALLGYRKSRGWPSPEVLGELRCVACHALMGDRPSACEDEDVCPSCAEAIAGEIGPS